MKPIEDPCADLTTGYLLVDVSNFSDIHSGRFKAVPCVPAALTNFEDLMPCLVSVKDLPPPQLEQMTDILRQQAAGEHGFAICAWLECDAEIEVLAEHLAQFLCGPGPDGSKVMWRFFDPRTFATAMAVFLQDQRYALLGPIKSWRLTWCRNWWLVSNESCRPNLLFNFQDGWPTEKQWQSIRWSRVLQNIMNALGADKRLTAEECLRYQNASIAYLNEGTQLLNLSDENDQSEFVYLCVKYGSAYRCHPKLAAGWEALKEKKISWTDLRFRLSAADFERLNSLLDS